ncbi:MAG TPA: hypothetical protein VFE33_25085 [Thermoanaerobaculia bacterium]|nr:hypothetical protein [Thermoanaerobaculia bacterium]
MRVPALVPILLFATGAQADTLLTIQARLETSPPPPVAVSTETEMQLWVGDHRMREDSPGLSTVIRRFDRGKLYFLDHRTKTYAEVDLPFDPLAGKPTTAGDSARERGQKARVTVTLTDEKRRIGAWNTRKVVVVSHDPGGDFTAEKWMSTEVGVDEGTLNQWLAKAVVPPPGSLTPEVLESQRQLDAIPGYPVLEETRSSRGPGETEFRWHKELVSAETKEPPAGLYDPPAGYRKVKVDQINMAPAGKP